MRRQIGPGAIEQAFQTGRRRCGAKKGDDRQTGSLSLSNGGERADDRKAGEHQDRIGAKRRQITRCFRQPIGS